MSRQPRLDAPGFLHHVMARGIERSLIFRRDEDRDYFLGRLGVVLVETETCCYAWSLLPNHFHLLLQTGVVPLSQVMRRLMTGYAVAFNRRYKRNGHLFQNRYKSIVCEKEPYLLELTRYIHLNPLRAGMVRDMAELERYPWSGHSVLMGRRHFCWQAVETVLGCFSRREGIARRKYRFFVEEGVDHGRRPELEGERGGVNDGGGPYDERVLGKRDFAQNVLGKTGNRLMEKSPVPLPDLIGKVLAYLRIEKEDLLSGRRKREVSSARALICYLATRKMGYRFSEVAEALNIHPVNAARSLEKGKRALDTYTGILDSLLPQ